MPNAYPLQWPLGKARSKAPSESRFGKKTVARARDEVFHQLDLARARNVVISTNIPLNQSGNLNGNFGQPLDKGVAVYFTLYKEQHCLACDVWNRIQDNLWAIAKHVEALRGQERWGVGTMKEAFAGFKALPDPTVKRPWNEVLGVPKGAHEDTIKRAYRLVLKNVHPDHNGGNDELAKEVNAAWAEFKKERGMA